TFVNGVRITRGPLAPGDRLKLGSVEFRLEGSSAPAPAAPSPVATDAGPSGPPAPPPPPSPAAGDVEEIVLEEPDAASGDRLEPIPPAVRRPRTDDPDRTIALSRRPAPRSPGFTPPRPSPSTDALRSARSGGVLRQDLAQQSFGRRLLYVLVAVGFAYGLFRITSALTETVVP